MLLLGLTTITVVAVGYLGVTSVQSIGTSARRTSAEALRSQAKEYLRQVTLGDVQKNDLVLRGVERDAQKVARYAGRVFENRESFAGGDYWRAEDHMFFGSEGQYMNGEEDVSSVFVPRFVEVDEATRTALELGAYLDFVFAPTYEGDANTVAIYLGTEYETTQYYPNISLGTVVSPDFRVTERPWYVSASPENNPDRGVVWSSVYADATGKGQMVTAAAPVYGNDQFIGVVGVDVRLEDITASIGETRLLGSGYGFLIDGQGRAIALPTEGYQAILGPDAAPEQEIGVDLRGTETPFAPILADMMAGSRGLETLTVGGRELYVAYAPLQTTGWSLANVVETRSVLQTLASLESDLERSTRSMVLTRFLPLGAMILAVVGAIGLFIARRLTRPIEQVVAIAEKIGTGHWDVSLPGATSREIGALVDAFRRMTDELRGMYRRLEDKVAARTRELRRRTIHLQASAYVAREASAIRDVEQLLDKTVDLISDRFGFYHAGIFLLDEAQEYAVLRAASSEGGKRMLARQHKLKVGEVGIVGYVADLAEPRIALDVGVDAVFFDNPDLPDTRSEMALPLELHDEVIGVLDVQSTKEAAFTEEDVEVLETMADQLALAIENARLLEQASARVREVGALLKQQSYEGWGRVLKERREWGYAYDGIDVMPRRDVSYRDDPQLRLPIQIRGQMIGQLDLEWPDRTPTREEEVLARAVVEEAGQALESARLFEEARTRAREQSVLGDLGQALAAQLEVDEVLEEAYRGATQLVDAENFFVGLYNPERDETVIRFNATGAQADQQITVLPADKGLSGYIVRTGEPVLIKDNLMERLSDYGVELIGEPASSWLGVPLMVGGEVLGVMAVQSYASEAAYDEHDLELLTAVASQTAIALESARLYEEAVETAERLREVDRLKSQFLANMSHELRTPLNSIIGFSRVVLKGIDGPITERQREDLEAIYNSGQHLLGLINDILDVSKIEAGKMELDFEAVDLAEIVNGVMSTAVALVKDKSVRLERSIPDDLPAITADERRVRQILLNLVSNAAKFTREGSICIVAEADADEVCLSVADTGPGIPDEEMEGIFEPFTQVDASTTREHGGTGLGLTISHSFVQLHGGRMWVESEVGEGATFYFTLPIEGPPSEVEEVLEPVNEEVLLPPEDALEEGSGRLILCVDDDTGVINLYRRYLHLRGYRVFGLTDSSRVLDVAKRLKPHAITLDVMMPEKDGWEVIRDLKEDPTTSHIPVIICSIVSQEERGMSLGAADYLVKPIMEEDLVAALDRLNSNPGRHQVLIVDDHAGDRNLLRRMIESQSGYEVVEAAGGEEAIDLMEQLSPHIVILDLLMPEVDGFTVLESIKSDEMTRSIPVIVVTAKELDDEDHSRLNHRVEALMHKGVLRQDELLEDVAAALQKFDRPPS
jgi:signal transduction histidine kinase/CheY-like chemotaxis protein/HAMP domain-containing protein